MPKRTRDHREVLIEDLKSDPQFAAQYVTAAIEESAPVFLRALRDVAEAHRMSTVAQEAGVTRESLYRTLSDGGNPRFTNLLGILRAVGLRVRLEAAEREPVLAFVERPARPLASRLIVGEAIVGMTINQDVSGTSSIALFSVESPGSTTKEMSYLAKFAETSLVGRGKIEFQPRVEQCGARGDFSEALAGLGQNG